jgi:hypothetical protein
MSDSEGSSSSGFSALQRHDTLDDCPICYTQIDIKTTLFPCKHLFCLECVVQWDARDSHSKTTCPICRTELTEARHSFDRNGRYVSIPLNLTQVQRQALEESPHMFHALFNTWTSSGPNPIVRQWAWMQHIHGIFFVMSGSNPVSLKHTQDVRIIQNRLQRETQTTITHRRVLDRGFTDIIRIQRQFGFVSDWEHRSMFATTETYIKHHLRCASEEVSDPAQGRLRPPARWSNWVRPPGGSGIATRVRTRYKIDKTIGTYENELPKYIQVTEINDLMERMITPNDNATLAWDLGPEVEAHTLPIVRSDIQELLRQTRQSTIRQRVTLAGLPVGMEQKFEKTLSNIHLPF